jgi:hypothetical protein
MNLDAGIPVFFQLIGYNLPAMIAMLAGMVWINATWQRHPPAARWAMIGFAWMFLTYVLAIVYHSFGRLFLPHDINAGRDDAAPYLVALSCCEALAYLFFLLALNAARYPYRPPQYYDQFAEDDDRPRSS